MVARPVAGEARCAGESWAPCGNRIDAAVSWQPAFCLGGLLAPISATFSGVAWAAKIDHVRHPIESLLNQLGGPTGASGFEDGALGGRSANGDDVWIRYLQGIPGWSVMSQDIGDGSVSGHR